jgi:hypothetical protein
MGGEVGLPILGLPGGCLCRVQDIQHEVPMLGWGNLVLIQAEQGYWAGDFDSYDRAPTWLRRLRARDQHC